MSRQPLLKLEKFSVAYGSVRAIDEVCLELNEGEIVTVIGPNGATASAALFSDVDYGTWNDIVNEACDDFDDAKSTDTDTLPISIPLITDDDTIESDSEDGVTVHNLRVEVHH